MDCVNHMHIFHLNEETGELEQGWWNVNEPEPFSAPKSSSNLPTNAQMGNTETRMKDSVRILDSKQQYNSNGYNKNQTIDYDNEEEDNGPDPAVAAELKALRERRKSEQIHARIDMSEKAALEAETERSKNLLLKRKVQFVATESDLAPAATSASKYDDDDHDVTVQDIAPMKPPKPSIGRQ